MTKEKVNVTLCVVKKEGTSQAGKPYKIYEVTTDKGKYDSFDEVTPGDHEVELIPDTSGNGYNGKLKIQKAGGFGGGKVFIPKDTKRETALTCAVKSAYSDMTDIEIIKRAEYFLEWLKK